MPKTTVLARALFPIGASVLLLGREKAHTHTKGGLVHSSLGKPNTTAEVFYVVSFQGMFHHFCICWLYRSILIQRGRQLHKAMKTTRWGSLVTTLEAGHQGFQVFRICTWTVAQISARIRYTYAEARVKTQCCHCPQPLWV